jgi:hypothetical protein
MTSGTTFDNHALAALGTHPGAWHCKLCWAREANLNRRRIWRGYACSPVGCASRANTSSPALADATDAGA